MVGIFRSGQDVGGRSQRSGESSKRAVSRFSAPRWINGDRSSSRRASKRSKAAGLAHVRTRGHVCTYVGYSLTRRSEVRFGDKPESTTTKGAERAIADPRSL